MSTCFDNRSDSCTVYVCTRWPCFILRSFQQHSLSGFFMKSYYTGNERVLPELGFLTSTTTLKGLNGVRDAHQNTPHVRRKNLPKVVCTAIHVLSLFKLFLPFICNISSIYIPPEDAKGTPHTYNIATCPSDCPSNLCTPGWTCKLCRIYSRRPLVLTQMFANQQSFRYAR